MLALMVPIPIMTLKNFVYHVTTPVRLAVMEGQMNVFYVNRDLFSKIQGGAKIVAVLNFT
jgi:hypothetical protein